MVSPARAVARSRTLTAPMVMARVAMSADERRGRCVQPGAAALRRLSCRADLADMPSLRPGFPIVSALALLAVAPAIAPASSGDGGNAVTTATTTVTGVVGNGASGVVSAPGQGLLPDNAVVIVKPKKAADVAGDDSGASADPEAASVPVVGERLGVTPEGNVRVQAPGGDWIALPDGATVPTGTKVDAREGSVTLTAAVDAAGAQQSAAFSGAVFTVQQVQSAQPVTKLVLAGGDFTACPKFVSKQVAAPFAAFAAKARRPVRSLFGSGHGSFRTQGRFAAATVRGTIWQTDDYCDRTVITVERGLVAVRDLHTGRSVEVPAGHSRTIRRR